MMGRKKGTCMFSFEFSGHRVERVAFTHIIFQKCRPMQFFLVRRLLYHIMQKISKRNQTQKYQNVTNDPTIRN